MTQEVRIGTFESHHFCSAIALITAKVGFISWLS
jgi:hypothetical protein